MTQDTPSIDDRDQAQSEAVKRFLGGVERINLALAAIALVVTGAVAGLGPVFYGVLVGGALGALNWRALVWLVTRMAHAKKHSRAFYGGLLGAKLVILMTAIWLLLRFLPIEALGFMLGISTLMLSIFAMGFKRALSPSEDGHQQGLEV